MGRYLCRVGYGGGIAIGEGGRVFYPSPYLHSKSSGYVFKSCHCLYHVPFFLCCCLSISSSCLRGLHHCFVAFPAFRPTNNTYTARFVEFIPQTFIFTTYYLAFSVWRGTLPLTAAHASLRRACLVSYTALAFEYTAFSFTRRYSQPVREAQPRCHSHQPDTL